MDKELLVSQTPSAVGSSRPSRSESLIQSGRNTIRQEAQALAGFVDAIDERFAEACEILMACRGTVLLTGMGKSGLVARKWAATFAGTGTKAYFLNPAEALHGDLGVVHSEDVLVALSYSGETEELGYLLRHARDLGVRTIGITGNGRSSLARQADLTLQVAVSEEACPLGLAPTTSTTLMMALGDALAVGLMRLRGFTEKDFARLHPGGSLGRRLWLRVSELMHAGEAIPRVEATDSLEVVLIEMTRKCLGIAVVLDAGQVAGVITDGDLRRFFQHDPKARGELSACQARQIMTRNPKHVSPAALAVEAREIMERHKIQQILVQEGEQLLGVVHLYDLLRARVV